jgi:hypothetical protein
MAHPCRECFNECYCNGDIDDAVVSKTPKNCTGCGCEELFSDDDADDFADEPVGYECIGCGKGFPFAGNCPICGNPLDPYG